MASIVLEEEFDAGYEPTQEEINEYGTFLGIDPETESEFLWIARDSLKAPLPANWKPCQTEDNNIYYFNFATGESTWDHPCDNHYKKLFQDEKVKKAAAAAKQKEAAAAPKIDTAAAVNDAAKAQEEQTPKPKDAEQTPKPKDAEQTPKPRDEPMPQPKPVENTRSESDTDGFLDHVLEGLDDAIKDFQDSDGTSEADGGERQAPTQVKFSKGSSRLSSIKLEPPINEEEEEEEDDDEDDKVNDSRLTSGDSMRSHGDPDRIKSYRASIEKKNSLPTSTELPEEEEEYKINPLSLEAKVDRLEARLSATRAEKSEPRLSATHPTTSSFQSQTTNSFEQSQSDPRLSATKSPPEYVARLSTTKEVSEGRPSKTSTTAPGARLSKTRESGSAPRLSTIGRDSAVEKKTPAPQISEPKLVDSSSAAATAETARTSISSRILSASISSFPKLPQSSEAAAAPVRQLAPIGKLAPLTEGGAADPLPKKSDPSKLAAGSNSSLKKQSEANKPSAISLKSGDAPAKSLSKSTPSLSKNKSSEKLSSSSILNKSSERLVKPLGTTANNKSSDSLASDALSSPSLAKSEGNRSSHELQYIASMAAVRENFHKQFDKERREEEEKFFAQVAELRAEYARKLDDVRRELDSDPAVGEVRAQGESRVREVERQNRDNEAEEQKRHEGALADLAAAFESKKQEMSALSTASAVNDKKLAEIQERYDRDLRQIALDYESQKNQLATMYSRIEEEQAQQHSAKLAEIAASFEAKKAEYTTRAAKLDANLQAQDLEISNSLSDLENNRQSLIQNHERRIAQMKADQEQAVASFAKETAALQDGHAEKIAAIKQEYALKETEERRFQQENTLAALKKEYDDAEAKHKARAQDAERNAQLIEIKLESLRTELESAKKRQQVETSIAEASESKDARALLEELHKARDTLQREIAELKSDYNANLVKQKNSLHDIQREIDSLVAQKNTVAASVTQLEQKREEIAKDIQKSRQSIATKSVTIDGPASKNETAATEARPSTAAQEEEDYNNESTSPLVDHIKSTYPDVELRAGPILDLEHRLHQEELRMKRARELLESQRKKISDRQRELEEHQQKWKRDLEEISSSMEQIQNLHADREALERERDVIQAEFSKTYEDERALDYNEAVLARNERKLKQARSEIAKEATGPALPASSSKDGGAYRQRAIAAEISEIDKELRRLTNTYKMDPASFTESTDSLRNIRAGAFKSRVYTPSTDFDVAPIRPATASPISVRRAVATAATDGALRSSYRKMGWRHFEPSHAKSAQFVAENERWLNDFLERSRRVLQG